MAIADSGPTRAEAERCSASLPVGMFGIDDVMIAIEVISFGFKLWQACKSPAESAEAVSAAQVTQVDQSEFRRARRRVRRAAVRQNLDLTTANLNGLTAHMLTHVAQADRASLCACCREPQIQDEDSND